MLEIFITLKTGKVDQGFYLVYLIITNDTTNNTSVLANMKFICARLKR